MRTWAGGLCPHGTCVCVRPHEYTNTGKGLIPHNPEQGYSDRDRRPASGSHNSVCASIHSRNWFRVSQKENTMATNKASGLPTSALLLADRKEKQGERLVFDAWIIRYNDMCKRGLTKKQWFAEYTKEDKRLTDYKWDTVDKYFGAITRAVKKYGSAENAVKAYLLDTQKAYVEVKFFIAWAPAGQRAKGVAPTVRPVVTKMWRKEEFVNDVASDLVEQGISRAEARKIANAIANKRFVQK